MPPPIAIFTLAIIWLSGIGFFAFTMTESAEESGSARTRSALARIHLSISALAMSVASKGPGVQGPAPVEMLPVLNELQAGGLLELKRVYPAITRGLRDH